MAVTHLIGPLLIGPENSATSPANATAMQVTPDIGPSQLFGGFCLSDPRFPYRGGAGTENNALMQVGIGLNAEYLVLDQAPSTAAVNNIAAAANVTSGTAMTLVSSTAAGITVMTSALFIQQTGLTVPTGKLAIDGLPALVFFGTCKSTAVADPTKQISRCVSISVASGGAGGALLVSGWDIYGVPMTEKITAASSPSGTTTTNGKKAFKFIGSVTPQFTNAFNYSVGTADIIGFPLLSQLFCYASIGFAGSPITSSTGFVAAVSTAATNTTGDVRGTYALQAVSDGVKTVQIFQSISPANIQTMTGYFGVTQA